MSFIGVVASKKCFENIQKKMAEEIKEEAINLLPINLRSIENVKNIKFETIIVEDSLEKFKNHKEIWQRILEKAEYVLINTDKNKEIERKPNQITYGLNQKADVTVSSISETDILVYWQKNLQDREGNKIEIEERRIKKEEKQLIKTYEVLIVYTLLRIYTKSIMQET